MTKDDLREVLDLVRAKLVADTEAACLFGDCDCDCDAILRYAVLPADD